MTRSFAEIVALYHERKSSRGIVMARAIDVRDQYNGDVVVPLPELDTAEKNAVANLLAQGLDQMAMRVASTSPDPQFPPLRPGIARHEQDADDRRKCVLGWWDENRMQLKDARRARTFLGYSSAPVIIEPDYERRMPTWRLLDPLMTYPAPSSDRDELTPEDCIFAYYQSLRWLKSHFPDAANTVSRNRKDENPEQLFELIEYVDADERVLGLLGQKKAFGDLDPTIQGNELVEIQRVPNLAGRCPVVTPGRITLDRPQGAYDGMLGMIQQQSMLQSLSVIATKRGIFKDEWVVARPNEKPSIVQNADGLLGQVGIITGGDIKEMPLDPSYMAPQMIDRLERSTRMEAGIPAEFGGESPSNVRTGRRGDSVLSETVDYTIQEAQRVFAYARQEEDKIAIAVDKAYWHAPKSFYVPWGDASLRLDYTPSKLWTTDEHRVAYSHAGVDENGMTVEVGQLIGTGLISKEYGRMIHPRIQDPARMRDEVVAESLEQALLASLQQQASQPGANVADTARIVQLVKQKDLGLVDAILQAQKEAQDRQASVDEQGNSTAAPPGSPPTQPGLAAPGQGAEAGSIQPPANDLANLANQLGALRRSSSPPPSAAPGQAA